MAQISFVSGSSFFAFDEQASKAGRFATGIKGLKNGQGVEARLEGADVEVDHMSAIASTGLAAAVQALGSAVSNTTAGVSLLQVADAALADFDDKLESMVLLSADAKSNARSELERAQINAEFQTLLSEIDELVANTEFSGTKVLQGNGSGGALQINYKVGTGNSDGDEIAVTINAASVSDLSATLASADLQSVDSATTARIAVASAQAALGEIQGAVSGKLQSFASASENSASMAGRHEQARAQRTTPAVIIDLAQIVAERVSEEQGIDLNRGVVEVMRRLILDLNSSLAKSPASTSTTDSNDRALSGNSQTPVRGTSSESSGTSEALNKSDRDAA
jgi:flagellin